MLELQEGAKGFQLSNVPVLECCCLQASLNVFGNASMKELVCKSRFLTGYLELLLEEWSKAREATSNIGLCEKLVCMITFFQNPALR